MKKKILSLALALTMTASLAACGNTDSATDTTTDSSADTVTTTEDTTDAASVLDELAAMSYDDASSYIYDVVLGDFAEAYELVDGASSVSERYALAALAEAKMLEASVMLPIYADGGNYGISCVAPNTAPYTLWGNDYERYHSILVATEAIKAEDRAEMKAKWAEVKTTGTYYEWAKEYLASKGYTLKDSYTFGYNSDVVNWDALATSRAADSEAIINTYDGLMEYDCEGILQPALAESYDVSADGTVYTFKIREGVAWVDSQGRKVGEVTADDFVAAAQHMMDAQGGFEYLIDGVIKNASEYMYGDITDFAEVGVKAVDDYTLEYTLEAPTSYFVTMLGYGVFAPMNRSYYESMGGKFGTEFDASAADYNYAKDSDSIAYCGPYLITNCTAENTVVFQANESYWNAENVTIKTMTWLYNDGTDPLKAYNDYKAGVLDGCGLSSSALEQAKQDGIFDDYAYIVTPNATSFMGFLNLHRGALANAADENAVVSTKTEDELALTQVAMLNEHFRRALLMSVDRATYNAQNVGDELKLVCLRNSYTPGTFVALEEEVTVDINGTSTTFPAGTFYGEIMQAQVDADGIAIKVWDPSADDGVGSSDGFDGWYNPEAAAAEFEKAVAELKEAGYTIDADHPVVIDYPVFVGAESVANRGYAFKQSVETALNNLVEIRIVECSDSNEWYYAGYYTDYGYEANYDFYDVSGWGPDYGDPATYLDTMLPDYAGYMMKCCGIF